MAEGEYWSKVWRARVGRRRALASAATAAGAAGLIAVGCGDDDNGGGGGSGQAAPSGTADTSQPKRGGMLRPQPGTAGEQPHHDPHLATTGLLNTRGSAVAYSRLVRRKLAV